ncbi:hypothetical protein [Hymenobacter weizhouensis]|uniref:hypothetical protein n=1 Tax=Hymenobacter sp. YIM 151500-1 TaxID=2987689 RepID=UPI002226ABB7|nr:hypothetical protein [Hymenobacter sp. YIM 151500-1]UYZ63946.1 hypothetical protein OIS53_03665 [Hymenobacter sp. YIM 151500-1]
MRSATAFIWFRSPGFTLEQAQAALHEHRLTVRQEADMLLVHDGGGPQYRVYLDRGPVVETQIAELAHATPYASRLAGYDQWLEVAIDDLDEALDEINTLIILQGTLQDATQGYLYLDWNGEISPPYAP